MQILSLHVSDRAPVCASRTGRRRNLGPLLSAQRCVLASRPCAQEAGPRAYGVARCRSWSAFLPFITVMLWAGTVGPFRGVARRSMTIHGKSIVRFFFMTRPTVPVAGLETNLGLFRLSKNKSFQDFRHIESYGMKH